MDDDTRPCRGCGEVGGLGWWRGRIDRPGSAGPRCHACYLTYCRARPSYPIARERKQAAAKLRPLRRATCRVCASVFVARQSNAAYCSQPCRDAAHNARRSELQPGVCPCGTPTANGGGLCRPCSHATTGESSPWPALTPIRYGFCLPCGAGFIVRPDHQHGEDNCSRRCAARIRHSSIGFGICVNCDGSFCSRSPRQVGSFCSQRCRGATQNRRRAAWKRAGRVGKVRGFSIRQVAERDGWRCHLCGRKVPDRPFRNEPDDPTEDHLVPLSCGGADAFENVALAHFACNTNRGVGGTAQLRLAV